MVPMIPAWLLGWIGPGLVMAAISGVYSLVRMWSGQTNQVQRSDGHEEKLKEHDDRLKLLESRVGTVENVLGRIEAGIEYLKTAFNSAIGKHG